MKQKEDINVLIDEDFNALLKTRFQIIGTIFIDSLFLLLWALISWGTAKVIEELKLVGIEEKLLLIFQWGFAISTLIAVLSFIAIDIWKVLMKTWLVIKKDLDRES